MVLFIYAPANLRIYLLFRSVLIWIFGCLDNCILGYFKVEIIELEKLLTFERAYLRDYEISNVMNS